MNDVVEERERLRLNVETFLREMYHVGEAFAAVPGAWGTPGVALMVFHAKDGRGNILAGAAIEDFDAWRKARE